MPAGIGYPNDPNSEAEITGGGGARLIQQLMRMLGKQGDQVPVPTPSVANTPIPRPPQAGTYAPVPGVSSRPRMADDDFRQAERGAGVPNRLLQQLLLDRDRTRGIPPRITHSQDSSIVDNSDVLRSMLRNEREYSDWRDHDHLPQTLERNFRGRLQDMEIPF